MSSDTCCEIQENPGTAEDASSDNKLTIESLGENMASIHMKRMLDSMYLGGTLNDDYGTIDSRKMEVRDNFGVAKAGLFDKKRGILSKIFSSDASDLQPY